MILTMMDLSASMLIALWARINMLTVIHLVSMVAPDLGSDLRWKGDIHDYHFLKIHIDDLDEFHSRVLKHKNR
jgi:hypothetical protein